MVGENQTREEWLTKAEQSEIIVFDLDGTLMDSDHANFLAYKDALMHVLSIQIEMNFTQGIRITRRVIKELIPCITNKQLEGTKWVSHGLGATHHGDDHFFLARLAQVY